MLKDNWLQRLVCREAIVNKASLESMEPGAEKVRAVTEAIEALRRDLLGRIRFVDRNACNDEFSLQSFNRASDELLNACGADRLLIILDYLQLVRPERDAEDPDRSRVDQICRLQRIAKTLASPLGATILAISEVTKQSDASNLGIEDLLGSARIGYAADAVMLLQKPVRHRDHRAVVPRTLRIAKARDGLTCPDISLQFDHRHYRFLKAPESAIGPSTARTTSAIDPLAGSRRRKSK